MSIEANYFGFIASTSESSALTTMANHPALESYSAFFDSHQQDGKNHFSLSDEQAYEAWDEMYRDVKAALEKESYYLIISYCDHDDYGCPVEAKLDGDIYEGYILLDDYFALSDQHSGSNVDIALAVEQRLRDNSLTLSPAPEYY